VDADAVEIRVLGCLLEKQRTTPDQYPLSLNSLRLAANQATNRDPVVDYDEGTIRAALDRLGNRGWTRLASGPSSRAAKFRHLLDDAQGVLQDTHWASGSIGYFATYLLGTVMSVQIWQKAAEDLPELEDAVGRGEFAPLRDWLGEHVHRLGRKFSPQETLRRATGSEIDAKPYLAYLESKYRAGVAA